MPLIEDLGTTRNTEHARFYSYTALPTHSQKCVSTGKIMGRSKRVATSENNRFADSATRQRAVKRRISELERENYNEQHLRFEIPRYDVSTSLMMSNNSSSQHLFHGRKRQSTKHPTNKSGSTQATRRILASRKTLSNLLDEDQQGSQSLNELISPPAKYPLKHLCSVCGFQGIYSCMKCGLRYCSLKCDSTHKETRCLKMYN